MTDLRADGGSKRGVWWLSPAGAVILVVPVTLLLAVGFTDARFRAAYGTPKYLTADTAALLGCGSLLFVVGALLAQYGNARVPDRWPGFDVAQVRVLRSAALWLYRLTLLGYIAYALAGALRGATFGAFVDAATSQDNFTSPLRTYFAPVAGITSLTQVGIACTVVTLLVFCHDRDTRVLWRLAVLFVLAMLRTFFLAERLAVLELALPAVTVLGLAVAKGDSAGARRLVQVAPAVLVPAVMVMFSAFEYSRSWVFYKQHSTGNFADFAIERLAGYYATAYNNAQLALMYSSDKRLPYGSIEAVWTAPLVSQLGAYERLTGLVEPDAFSTTLSQYGNPEFNSPGGLGIPFVDYGHVGGLLFFFLAGCALGWAYKRCCAGTAWAVLLYPVAVTGLFELPRYLYWGQGRVAPSIVCLLVVARYLRAAAGTGAPSEAGAHGRWSRTG